MDWRRVVAIIAVAMWLASCNATFDIAAPPDDVPLYAKLYPYYAELCAVSQIRKKPGFGADTSGGPGGHSVFYLNGVCRDRDAGYPTLALCAAGVDNGVGLSVNAHFENANWVATDGRAFFFDGNLSPNERLTREGYAQAQAEAKAKGLLDGVVFHSQVFDDMPAGMSHRHYMYEVSIATDYAIAFGRDRYCARVPVTRDQMAKMVDYLNGVNAVYRDGKKKFEWNVLQNNCTHLAHNALAAAGLWDEWETDRFLLIAAFDFPVPKNEFVNLMRRTNDTEIVDPQVVYDDRAARRELMEDDSLPARPGALAEAQRVIQNNDVYDTDLQLIFYDDPVFGSYERHFREIYSKPRYSDIRANLRYFASLYRSAKAGQKKLSQNANADVVAKSKDFVAFSARFYNYIDREALAVETRLELLDRFPVRAGKSVVSDN